MSPRLLPLVIAAFALSGGCNLSNPAIGAACGDQSVCPRGLSCDPSGHCAESDAGSANSTCTLTCGAGQKCLNQACVGLCAGVSCEPASVCFADAGTCNQVAATGALGSACAQDSDCGTAGLICLVPYGGELEGVCTAECGSGASVCTAAGQICTQFTSDAPSSTIQLCADPSLTPCVKDSDCSSATSNFTCVVATVNTTFGSVSASLCAPSVAGSLPTGQPCTLAGQPCASGLCIQAGGTSRYCSTPCSSTSDCTGLFTGTAPSQVYCEPVTIALQDLTKRTRANLCIIGSPSYDVMCGATGGSNCHADAPNCVMNAAGTAEVCAPYCTDGITALQCSTTEGSELMCDSTTEICH